MTDVLAVVALRLEAEGPSNGRHLVAIDGIGASGKTTFARALADRFTSRAVVLLHADDFFNPPEVRHARGRNAPEGFWLDTYDYDALIGCALGPLKTGRQEYRPSSRARPTATADDAIVLVEGTFLHRERLAGYWDSSVYLHVPFAIAAERMALRGTITDVVNDPRLDRYLGAQHIYFEHTKPWERASVIVDNTDFAQPRIIDALQLSGAEPTSSRFRPQPGHSGQ